MINSTYNKQWNDAQNQISDLLQIEIPKTEPKPETVIYCSDNIIWLIYLYF
jgi:hypothetical protein